MGPQNVDASVTPHVKTSRFQRVALFIKHCGWFVIDIDFQDISS